MLWGQAVKARHAGQYSEYLNLRRVASMPSGALLLQKAPLEVARIYAHLIYTY